MAPRIRVALAALILVVLHAAPARANVGLHPENDGRLSGPQLVSGRTPLVVEEERLSFVCGPDGGGVSCTFEARYRVHNPTAEPQGGLAAFYGLRSSDVVVRVNGRPVTAPLSPEAVQALDAQVDATADAEPGQGVWSPYLERHGFRLEVAPGGRAEILTVGHLEAEGRIPYLFLPALRGRHGLLHSGNTEDGSYTFNYMFSPIRTWASLGRLSISVRYPRGWTFTGHIHKGEPSRPASWRRQEGEGEGGDEVTETLVLEGQDAIHSVRPILQMHFGRPGDVLEHGGPFVGVGGVLGDSAASGFRMRFGYEVGTSPVVVEALTADVDFRGRLSLALQAEAALPHLFIFPSLSVGLGLPVQVLPEVAPGVRLLGSLQWYPLGFVVSGDIFPGLAPEEGRYQVMLLGRFSL